jgi:hypothetical protein
MSVCLMADARRAPAVAHGCDSGTFKRDGGTFTSDGAMFRRDGGW